MGTNSRDDILVATTAEASRPLRVQLAAYIPITIALIGVAAILLGGISADDVATVAVKNPDPIATGSIR